MQHTVKPLVFSCSGCSSAAQMANHFALRLDRENLAEMSCIAGVGGLIPALLRVARKPRPILALDGCPLHCVLACLQQADIAATLSVDLSTLGVKKLKRNDFSMIEANEIWQDAILPAIAALTDLSGQVWQYNPNFRQDAEGSRQPTLP